jgi:hypothetical protein
MHVVLDERGIWGWFGAEDARVLAMLFAAAVVRRPLAERTLAVGAFAALKQLLKRMLQLGNPPTQFCVLGFQLGNPLVARVIHGQRSLPGNAKMGKSRCLTVTALEGRPLPKQILPFDPNDGAGFWFSNAHNTFTRNVAVECRQYGFRLEATPKAGLIATDGAPKRDFTFGDGKKLFDLVMNIRQPDGGYKPVDIRTLPFVRFEGNETHGNGFWGINLGLGAHGVGPDSSTPHIIKNLKIWSVVGGVGIESPCVLIDGMTLNDVTYGVRGSIYKAQDWRNVSINSRGRTIATLDEFLKSPSRRHRQPGWTPEGTGDGGARLQAPEGEAVKLNPIDKLPPITAITHIRKEGSQLFVRGTTSDNGTIKRVTVNGKEAKVGSYGEWEITLDSMKPGAVKFTALAEDVAGNTEKTAHEVTVVIR